MIFRTDNPIRDFEMHEAYQEEQLKKRPVCEHCGEPITDDYYYKIDDCRVCSDCLKDYCNENFKKSID